MSPDSRRELLFALQRLDLREDENFKTLKCFLPLWNHKVALRPETVVIRGGRGAGKTALFKLVRELGDSTNLRNFFDELVIPDAAWLDAFSELDQRHPTVQALDAHAIDASDEELRAFWMGHLLCRLKEKLVSVEPRIDVPVPLSLSRTREANGVSDVAAWSPIALQEIGSISSALDALERDLANRDQLVFATYDHLDRIGQLNTETRRRLVKALLALWLSLSNRYRQLRAKIFIREDLFDPTELAFPDATKLKARSVSLEWDVESLFRVVVRHIAETSTFAREWLNSVQEIQLIDRGNFGWMPGPMPEPTRAAFAEALAGPIMGKGTKKGYTYRWIPAHLQEANVRIVPRSILSLIGIAARKAFERGGYTEKEHRLLSPKDLAAALPETSLQRVGEISEEYPLTKRLENLRGENLLLRQSMVIERLGRPRPDDDTRFRDWTDGRAIMNELVRLGVLSLRPDGRIDVPDIFRYGFGIKRKGGVAMPK